MFAQWNSSHLLWWPWPTECQSNLHCPISKQPCEEGQAEICPWPSNEPCGQVCGVVTLVPLLVHIPTGSFITLHFYEVAYFLNNFKIIFWTPLGQQHSQREWKALSFTGNLTVACKWPLSLRAILGQTEVNASILLPPTRMAPKEKSCFHATVRFPAKLSVFYPFWPCNCIGVSQGLAFHS